ncbi:MAG: CPBP family intramembrane metalloprotease [Bacteroidetes bacterium]|nr:CPBP family intramembrane metalloprotease [Bacteroidota bacterium]MDA1119290.1 CPBP family intramembrane metalloprotease [Bacteroidota bacterium]
MENTHSEVSSHQRNPFLAIVFIILFAIAGMFVGNFVGLIVILPFFDFSIAQTMAFLADPMSDASGRVPLLLVQGVSGLFTFIIAPILYLRIFEKKGLGQFATIPEPLGIALLLTVAVWFSFMFLNTPIIEWNMNIDFPDFFEAFARGLEDELKDITEFLTSFENIGQLLLGLIIIAIIPGIGEELIFRGLIQQKFYGVTKNAHAAIWLTGLLFGVIHFQFYGMIPRMFLGVLFGYLYWWSGSLLLAILAHFLTNGFTLIMVYLYQQDIIKFNIDGTSEIPLSTVLMSGVLFGLMFYYFFKLVKHRETHG